MKRIKKNNLYIFDNLYDKLEIVISLEDENILSYDENVIYNSEIDLVEVLSESKIKLVQTSDLYEIERINKCLV